MMTQSTAPRNRAPALSRLSSLVWLLVLVLPVQIAHAKSTCLDAVRWKGTSEDIAVIREALSGGVLISQGPQRCRGARVRVEHLRGAWNITITHGGSTTRTSAQTTVAVATWIESRLVPPVAIILPPGPGTSPKPPVSPAVKSPAKQPPAPTSRKPPRHRDPKDPVPPAKAPAASAVRPFSLGASAGAGFNGDGAGFLGVIEGDYRLFHWLSLGVEAGWFHLPMQDSLGYDLFHGTARAAVHFSLGPVDIAPGLAAGYEGGTVERSGVEGFGTGVPTQVNTSKPRLDLFLSALWALTDRFVLTLRVSLRYTPLDGTISASSPGNASGVGVPDVSADTLRRAFPLSDWSVFVRLGIAWRFGGRR